MKEAAGIGRGVGDRQRGGGWKKHPTPCDRHGFKLLKVRGEKKRKKVGW